MKTEMMRDIVVKREGLTPPFQLTLDKQTDAISVCYSPHLKLVSAEWVREAASDNIRHAIRLLARTTAVLRAELLLIAIPSPFHISDDDMRWIGRFIQEAMRHSPVRKVARVVPPLSPQSTQSATLQSQATAYELAFFDNMEEAQRWLLGDRYAELTEKDRIHVPLQFNLKHIRTYTAIGVADASPVMEPSPPDAGPQKVQVLDICTDFVAISIDQEKKLMQIKWKKQPLSRQYRYGLIKACRVLIEHKLEALLLNNQRLGILTLEDQGWLVSMAQKMLPKSNLQKLAVVTAPNALQQLSSETIGQRLKDASLQHTTRYFLSEEEALGWLLTS